jgi:hypothetical protein
LRQSLKIDLNAKENEPSCAQETGPTRCAAGRKIGWKLMIKILATGRQRREDALFAVGFTEKSADGRRSQNVSLVTEAKHFLAEAESIRRFRFFGKRNKNVRDWTAGAKVSFPLQTGHS